MEGPLLQSLERLVRKLSQSEVKCCERKVCKRASLEAEIKCTFAHLFGRNWSMNCVLAGVLTASRSRFCSLAIFPVLGHVIVNRY